MPLKKLKYAQVIKERDGKDLISVTKKIIFGDPEDITDSEISTSHIERQNLNLRQENKRLARKTIAYSKKDEWLQHSLTLQMTAHNFQRPHHALKKLNLKRIKEKVWKKHDKVTPMMSAGITKHI